MKAMIAALTLLLLPVSSLPSRAATVCTLIADAETAAVLVSEGDCERRVTPASTFKIALSLMGFDSGFLADAHAPVLPFQKGDPDWGGAPWKKPTDPAHWMRHSVVWYSQRIAQNLGRDRFRRYTADFGYGNADVSGDAGKGNGLKRSWIGSSLEISPVEQVTFLRKLLNGTLPVTERSTTMTRQIVEKAGNAAGWDIFGKTGSALTRSKGGSFSPSRGLGWYVGWASKGDRTLVFARLIQDERRERTPGGLRARDALVADWPELATGF